MDAIDSDLPSSSFQKALPGIMKICQMVSDAEDWKLTLDEIVPAIRNLVIFDNFAIYQKAAADAIEDVIYARAIGRGKTLGEEISWGETLAARVFTSHQVEFNQPKPDPIPDQNRLNFPFIIGLPVHIQKTCFVVTFIRFGGPAFTPEETQIFRHITCQLGLLLKQKQWSDQVSHLEGQLQQSVLQEDLLSTVSHELLSPVGFIKGYTTTLLRSDTTWDLGMQHEFLSIIDEETDRLVEMIDQLLDSARLQSGTMTIDRQPLRLDSLLRDVAMRAVLHQPDLHIKLKIEQAIPQIYGDSRRLTQVFENLINNSIKYAPGSSLTITALYMDNQIQIVFADEGPGISEQYLPHLFQKFYRAPANGTEVRGTGLGLYISRQIILAHRGAIFAEAGLSTGTAIHILLPVDAQKIVQEGNS